VHPVPDPATQVTVERRKFSRTQVLEGTAAAVLAAAIIGTAGGMGWLVVQLPSRLQQIEGQITRLVQSQNIFSEKFVDLEKQVQDHDRRLIRLEIRR
jgi:hypothetical protein